MKAWRSPAIIAAFEQALKEKTDLGLCPVTDSIVRRHSAYIRQLSRAEEIPVVAEKYGVFLSFGNPDQLWAQRVFEFITKETGHKVFFAPYSLPQHPGLWNKAIYPALRSASSFVVVATNPEHLTKRRWVDFEINFFHQVHPDRDMIPIISGFDHQSLPDPLPAFDASTWNDEREFGAVLQQLRTRISRSNAGRSAAGA